MLREYYMYVLCIFSIFFEGIGLVPLSGITKVNEMADGEATSPTKAALECDKNQDRH